MTELELRRKFVAQAEKWAGYSEANGKFKSIIDLYNTQKPLPRGYAVQYDDEWCATYVTAVGIASGMHSIILAECSCAKMIEKYKAAGRWEENDAYVPRIGDIVMYYWKDSKEGYATTDCKANPNHVGIVAKVSGNKLSIIEGNKGEAVAYRPLLVNGRYIRGYCLPDFAKLATTTPAKPEVLATKRYTAKAAARSFDRSMAGQYVVTAANGLHMRHGHSKEYGSLVVLPHSTVVTCYGYYTKNIVDNKVWLYVQAQYKGATYTGFCHAGYLRRK